jgi:membrane protein
MGSDRSEPEEATARPAARTTRAVAWGKETTARATAWAVAARETHASVDVGFRVADRDKRHAAGVLAGGVAYRFFFWLLALALLLGGVLGFADADDVETASEKGMGAALADAVGDAVRSSQTARWWLVLLGFWLLLWTGYMGAKALMLVHAVIWGVPPVRFRNALVASLVFTAGAAGLLGAISGSRWLRADAGVLGIVATAAVIAVPFGLWLAVSVVLPHGTADWRDLVPGAVLVACGVEALHLFTALFLGPKLASATELYGGIGVATTMLLWLYLAGRLVIAAAILNVSMVERREGA